MPLGSKDQGEDLPAGFDTGQDAAAGPRASAVPPTAEAYRAARAALAAEMVGPLYGRIVEPELEPEPAPVAPQVPQAPLRPAARAVPVAQVSYTTSSIKPPPVAEPPRHRRALVVAIAGLLVGMFALATEAIPLLMPGQPSHQIAGADPSIVVPAVVPTETEEPTATVTPTATPTATPTPKVTPKPTPAPTKRPAAKKPAPKVTPKPTPKPTPALSAAWSGDQVPPNFKVQTLAGAVCTITRTNVSNGKSRTSGQFTAGSNGLATLKWTVTWQSGTKYDIKATCTLNGKSASTPTVRITAP
jgi:hypothetical protein